MTFNNKGYDYLMENSRGTNVRIEEKYRNKGNKYEITPAQEKIADVLKTEGFIIDYKVNESDNNKQNVGPICGTQALGERPEQMGLARRVS